jgi:hypothetical protein
VHAPNLPKYWVVSSLSVEVTAGSATPSAERLKETLPLALKAASKFGLSTQITLPSCSVIPLISGTLGRKKGIKVIKEKSDKLQMLR